MIQGIEETMVDAFDMGVLATNTMIKNAVFRFLEIALIEMIHEGTQNFMRIRRTDPLS